MPTSKRPKGLNARTVFTTHYHKLNEIKKNGLGNVAKGQAERKKKGAVLEFTHKVVQATARKSKAKEQ